MNISDFVELARNRVRHRLTSDEPMWPVLDATITQGVTPADVKADVMLHISPLRSLPVQHRRLLCGASTHRLATGDVCYAIETNVGKLVLRTKLLHRPMLASLVDPKVIRRSKAMTTSPIILHEAVGRTCAMAAWDGVVVTPSGQQITAAVISADCALKSSRSNSAYELGTKGLYIPPPYEAILLPPEGTGIDIVTLPPLRTMRP